MGWETRIFFDISDEQIKKALTLDNAAVANIVLAASGGGVLQHHRLRFPVEERTDDYVLLTGCPHAEQIGLKARDIENKIDNDSYYSLFELKTTVAQQPSEDDGDDDHLQVYDEALACWIKTSQCVHGSITNRETLSKFLNGRLHQQPLAKTVLEWIDESSSSSSQTTDGAPLDIVRAKKRRRQTQVGNVVVEETDVIFTLAPNKSQTFTLRPVAAASRQGEAAVTPPQRHDKLPIVKGLTLRSWAVEGDDMSPLLATIAKQWRERFSKAATAVELENRLSLSMWVASYPEMVLQVPHLLGT